ncbi:thioesterase family protein [Pseudonocardia zijingensis]|jgi:fluoroacetyl-CoA thioesterase|uniref:Fluoroacetyl-CoA-specific thioesterase-like domain-containing protein n=1 Tax=Pseudonocardia zijingensis TaxID=153376 RepID=A0ABN1PPC1_9PSEU
MLTVGTTETVTYRVGRENMVQRLLPGVPEFIHKPEVMASGWLLGVCEWPPMLAISRFIEADECSLGTRFELTHVAPVPAGATLTVTAHCTLADGRYSEWQVDARDDVELVASGVLGFCVVGLARFTARRLDPKSALLQQQQALGRRVPKPILAGVAAMA